MSPEARAPGTRDVLIVDGAEITRGSRVRLRPDRQADAFDLLLAGRVARVEAIEVDFEERVLVAVSIEDDPGQDLGAQSQVGHRFFFHPTEIEPVA